MTAAPPRTRAVPLDPGRLARTVAAAALARTGLRIGVEGPVESDAHLLADAVTAEIMARSVPVARVCGEDFWRARSLRLEHGRDDPHAFAEDWYDLAAIRREVLAPMVPGNEQRSWLPRLRDPRTDRPYREPRRDAPPSAVVVLDGRFLGRPELAEALDVRVLLDVTPSARARRVPAEERARVLPAWERYVERYGGTATFTVRYDHPDRPALRVAHHGTADHGAAGRPGADHG